jgi:hypothetical protein
MADNSLSPRVIFRPRPSSIRNPTAPVIPVKAGIQRHWLNIETSLDSRLRGNDGYQ